MNRKGSTQKRALERVERASSSLSPSDRVGSESVSNVEGSSISECLTLDASQTAQVRREKVNIVEIHFSLEASKETTKPEKCT